MHFADALHHANEERRLFPVLAGHGLAPEASIVGALVHQHDAGRALRPRDAAQNSNGCVTATCSSPPGSPPRRAPMSSCCASTSGSRTSTSIRLRRRRSRRKKTRCSARVSDRAYASERRLRPVGTISISRSGIVSWVVAANRLLATGRLPLDELLLSRRTPLEDPELPPWRAGARPAARWSGTSRCTSPRRSRTRPACCRSRCAARRSRRGRPIRASARTSARSSKTSLELALSGRVAARPVRDATRSATRPATWRRSGAATSPIRAQILYLPQNANSVARGRRTCATSTTALRRRHRGRSRARRSPTTTCAARSRVFNENRRLLRELYAIKRETPWLLAGRRSVRAGRARRPDPARGAQRAAARACCRRSRPRQARPQDKVRVVFEGGFCEQPPLDLLRAHRASPATSWTTTC